MLQHRLLESCEYAKGLVRHTATVPMLRKLVELPVCDAAKGTQRMCSGECCTTARPDAAAWYD